MRLSTLLAAASLLTITSPVFAAGPHYACFPTCSANDARFVSLADPALSTMHGSSVSFQLTVPGSATQLRFAIFDGDNAGQWDSIDATVGLTYTLYADPQANGTGTLQLDSWTDTDFTDNAWTTLTANTSSAALALDNNYSYRLDVVATIDPLGWTNFKVRVEDGALFVLPQAIAFNAALFHWDDVAVIYPDFPTLTPTTYDGTWDLYLYAASAQTRFEIWDGDLDFGSADCQSNDTDDLDTSNTQLPPWADLDADHYEDVAQGEQKECGITTGAPADDNDFAPYLRAPSVVYSITTPLAVRYDNDNPSGNCEWEQFALDLNPLHPADYTVAALPAGIYHLHMVGVDIDNLGLLRPSLPLLGVDSDGIPVNPLSQSLLAQPPARTGRGGKT